MNYCFSFESINFKSQNSFEINRSNPFTPIAERFTSAQHQSPPGGILRPLSSTEPTQVEGALKTKDPDGVADGYSVV